MPQNYFRHFPTIDFDVKNDGNLIEAKDIFRNIRVSSEVADSITGYEYTYIGDQDRPDVLATKLYADPTLYWLFWMVNDHLATYEDWPKSQRVLEKYIKRKYSGKALVSSVSTDIVNTSEDKFLQGEKVVGSTSSAFGYVTKIDPTNNQIVVNDTQGSFQQGETVTGSKSNKSFTLSSVRSGRYGRFGSVGSGSRRWQAIFGRFGTVRFGTVRFGTVRYGSVPFPKILLHPT